MDIVIELDATDDLEHPELHPITLVTGVADRIAALEMLYVPVRRDRLAVVGDLVPGRCARLGGGAEIPKTVRRPSCC